MNDAMHYKSIIAACDAFLDGRTSLPQTVSDLEGLIAALEEISSEDRNQFLSRWGVLEDLFSASLYEPDRRIIESSSELLTRTLAEIRSAAQRRSSKME
jgi:hypothetical protein